MNKDKLINKYLPADYQDCFSRSISSPRSQISVDWLYDRMFGTFPAPVRWLLRLRDAMVKPFGLKVGSTFRDRILERNDHEIILSSQDRHLDFWVSLYCSPMVEGQQMVSVSTVVRYRNRAGRLYFSLIRIFHRLLVRSLLHRTLKQ